MIRIKLGAGVILIMFFTGISVSAQDSDWKNLISEAQRMYNYGQYDKAEELDTKALEFAEKEGDPKQIHLSVCLNNLGMVLKAKHLYLQAELIFQRALEIDEKNYGPDSVMITASLTNLAFLYKEQGQYEKTEPYFKRPLEIYEKTFPNGHPQILECMRNLAFFYRAAHRTQEAEEMEQRIANILTIKK